MTRTQLEDIEKQKQEKAWRAVQAFRQMTPQLQTFARVLTKNPNVKIFPLKEAGAATDGRDKIWIHPPIELGDKLSHNRSLCNRRGPNLRQQCPACHAHEKVMYYLYHEIGHIVNKSNDSIDEAVRKEYIDLAKEWHPVEACNHLMTILQLMQGADSYGELSHNLNPFMFIIWDAIEDARVDERMFQARPGLRTIFQVGINSIMSRGFQSPTGEYVMLRDAPANGQAIMYLISRAAGRPIDQDDISPEVWERVVDDELHDILDKAIHARDSHETFSLALKAWRRMDELGFCHVPKCVPTPSLGNPDPEKGNDENPGSDSKQDGSDSSPSGMEGVDPSSSESDRSDPLQSSDPDRGDDSGSDGADEGDGSVDDPESSGDQGADDEAGTPDGGSDSEGASSTPGDGKEESSSDHESGEAELPDDDQGEGDDRSRGGDDEVREGNGSVSGDDEDGQSSSPSDSSEGRDEDGDEPDLDAGERDSEGDSGNQSGSRGAQDRARDGDGESESDEEEDLRSHQGDPDRESDEQGDSDSSGQPTPTDGPGEDGDEADGGEPEEAEEDGGRPLGESVWDQENRSTSPIVDAGSPEDIERVIRPATGHGENHVEDVLAYEDSADGEESASNYMLADPDDITLGKAVQQMGVFDSFANGVQGLIEINYPNARANWPKPSSRVNPDDFMMSEATIGKAVRDARIVFSENLRAKHSRNLKSGRIATGVLGRRAPVEDPRLFARKTLPKRRDYFVVIGMDVSGSTMTDFRLERIKRSVFGQAELLHRLGIPFVISAHTGGFDPKRMWAYGEQEYVIQLKVKDANEPWNEKAKQRLADINSLWNNFDGHTLEYYRKLAEQSSATDRIILYYTDGDMPYANYEEELSILQREIKHCKSKGIHLLAVGINTDSPADHGFDTCQVDSDDDLAKVINHLKTRLTR